MTDPPNIAAELEALGFGIAGQTKIKQLLSKTRKVNTLINAIVKFQDENEIQMDHLRPALQLLDLHGITRLEFHEQAVFELTEKLKSRIRYLGECPSAENTTKLESLLEKCFHTHRLQPFRPIVLELLRQIPQMQIRYLDLIKVDTELYADCAINVKQQIWANNEELFAAAVRPAIDNYLRDKMALTCAVEQSQTNFFTVETTRARRQWPQVQALLIMVGIREDLYFMLLRVVRQLFQSSGNIHLCSLRVELTMAAHDVNNEILVKADLCHQFAWCLDCCVRDKHLEGQQATKLRCILDTIDTSDMDFVIDMAMVAADVHVVHFICTTLVKKLRDNPGAHLPRDMPTVQLIIRILVLGFNARLLSQKREVPSEMIDSILFTKFLTLFAAMMVEDHARGDIFLEELSPKDEEEFHLPKLLEGPSPTVQTFLRNNPVAAILWFHYCLDMLPSKRRVGDTNGFVRYACYLPNLHEKLAVQSSWCHLFIHRLVYSNQFEPLLAMETFFQKLLLEDILLKNVEENEAVKYQVLRLISQLGFVWGVSKCLEILDSIAPDSGKVRYQSTYEEELYKNEFAKIFDKINPKSSLENIAEQVSPIKTFSSPPLAGAVRQYPAATPRHSFG